MQWMSRHPQRRPLTPPPPSRPERQGPLSGRWSRSRNEPPAPERRRAGTPAGRHGPCVLVVDDDDFGRETLGHILEAGGYRVLRASDGMEALDVLAGAVRPSLIVLDLYMPTLDGVSLIRRLQEDSDFDIPLVVVSAAGVEDWDDGGTGVVARFEKPLDVEDLLAAIREHLG